MKDVFVSRSFQQAGIRHGFFSRNNPLGEAGALPLNVGKGRSQEDAVVEQNRSVIAQFLEVPVEKAFFTNQQHTANVKVVTEAGKTWKDEEPIDALVTKTPGLLLAIYTADCVPVLLSDPTGSIVGVAHCGWKGLAQHILAETVHAMRHLGAKKIEAAIGPCIHAPHYSVQHDFLQNFTTDLDCVVNQDGLFYFDLPKLAKKQLGDLGIVDIDALRLDTYENEDLFFSFRRSTERQQPLEGVQASAIVSSVV